MKSLFLNSLHAVLFASLLAPLSIYGEDNSSSVTKPQLFTYQPPVGWTVQQKPNETYPVATETKDGNLQAGISIDVDHTSGALDEWCHNSLTKSKAQFASYNATVGELTPFTTSKGAAGFRAIITLTANSNKLAFFIYFFSGSSDAKIVVTCTCQQSDFDHYLSVFDGAMKTFVPL